MAARSDSHHLPCLPQIQEQGIPTKEFRGGVINLDVYFEKALQINLQNTKNTEIGK